VASLMLPPLVYRPPILSGLTYTGWPRAIVGLPTSLPMTRGPFLASAPRTTPPLAQRLSMPTAAYRPVVPGGGSWSGMTRVGEEAAIGVGPALGVPEAVADRIVGTSSTAVGGYVIHNGLHNMTHSAPGPTYQYPKYDLRSRLEPHPSPRPLQSR
jgi:hypothetical protein